MFREYEFRKMINDNCWKKVNKDGIVEFFNKDYYDSDYKRIEDKLLKDIENEINR